MQLPRFDEGQIAALAENFFAQNVADILNLLFGTKLDGWSVEFGIGRYPVKPVALHGKITVAESWHNPSYRFERLVNGIEKALRQSDQISRIPSDWLMIASRIAVLFGSYGLLRQNGTLEKGQLLDVALPAGDCSALMAAWYAAKMGLPVGMIVCCCKETSVLWNLFHKGELRPDGRNLPKDLERLIFGTLGRAETERFCRAISAQRTYQLDGEQLSRLREGIFVSVVSDRRIASTLPNLYKTTGFLADPDTALSYSGLGDYRAAAGENRQALIIAEESPRFWIPQIADCMGISVPEVKEILK
jgi:threonine synthase